MKAIRKVKACVLLVFMLFQFALPVNSESNSASSLQNQKLLFVCLDPDRMISFALTESAGFVTYDIKNPENPVQASYLDLKESGTFTSMKLYGNFIYAATADCLHAIDVSDPYHPLISYQLKIQTQEGIKGFETDGNLAYVFDSRGINVVSLEDPELPVLLTSYEVNDPYHSDGITGLAVRDGFVYAACGYNGINIFDFTDLNNIRYDGSLNDVQGFCKNIGSAGDFIFVYIAEAEVVEVLDISSGANPKTAAVIKDIDPDRRDCGIEADNNLIFLPDGSNKIHVIENTPPGSFRQVGLMECSGVPEGIAIRDDALYVYDNCGKIHIFNTTSPFSPQKAQNSSSPQPAQDSSQQRAAGTLQQNSESYLNKTRESGVRKTAYITIDDGPSRNNTPRNLDTLKKYGIKATFFVLPHKNLDDIYKRIIDEGHVIGNHSSVHDYNYLYGSAENFKSDVLKAQNFIYDKFHYKSTVYRFPGGTMGRSRSVIKERAEILNELGYKYFDWDVSTADTDPNLKKIGSDEQIVNKLANNVIKGAGGRKKLIILMHDSAGKTYSAKALPKIIEGLKKQGYGFDVLTNY